MQHFCHNGDFMDFEKIKEKAQELFDKISTFKITSNIWVLSGIFAGLILLIITPIIITTNYLADQTIEASIVAQEEEFQLIQSQLDSYKEEIADVVQIRDSYRSSIQEIVELLYVRDTHLGIGGQTGPTIEGSDQINLLTIRNIIASMEDDQRMLSEVRHYLTARREFIESFPFMWPVDVGGVPHVSSGFGFREDVFNVSDDPSGLHLHAGIDIDLPIGTPVIATAEGTVMWAGEDEYMGYIIVLRHANGFTTGYSHLNTIEVRTGQRVERGHQIGTVGNTGMSTGPHLHYEIRQNGIAYDPMIFLSTNF